MDLRAWLSRNIDFILRSLWVLIIGVGLYWVVSRDLKMLGVLPLPLNANVAVAAWVQALGSVMAIVAAIFIANGQRREQIRDRRNRDAVVVKAVFEVLKNAVGYLEFLNGELVKHGAPISSASPQQLRKAFQFAEESFRVVNSIDLMSLPYPELVISVLRIKALLQLGLETARNGSTSMTGGPLASAIQLASQVLEAIERRMP